MTKRASEHRHPSLESVIPGILQLSWRRKRGEKPWLAVVWASAREGATVSEATAPTPLLMRQSVVMAMHRVFAVIATDGFLFHRGVSRLPYKGMAWTGFWCAMKEENCQGAGNFTPSSMYPPEMSGVNLSSSLCDSRALSVGMLLHWHHGCCCRPPSILDPH